MIGIEDRIRLRLAVVGLVVLAMLAVLLARLWFLQVLAGESFAEASERNSVRIVSVEAPRGRILDRTGRVLVENRSALAVGIRKDDLPRDPGEARTVKKRLGKLLGMSVRQIDARLNDVRTSPFEAAVIASDVPEEIIFAIRERRATRFPGVETLTLPVRRYPMGKLASHILGYVGETNDQELAALAPEYRLGDSIGRAGVERSYEEFLRGTTGLKKLEVDARGRVLRVLGPTQDPVPGNDIRLTIDARAQRVAERALREGMQKARTASFHRTGERFEAPAGAAVVMDVDTGEIMAMASLPMYDVREFVGGVSADYWAFVNDADNQNPLLNRAIQTSYPPGSTIKPVYAVAALETGDGAPGGLYPCQTAFRFGDTVFRNWQPRDARITLEQSLVESCDTVYYNFARTWWFREQNQLAAGRQVNEVMQRWAGRFGLGALSGIDLPQEVVGRVPGREWKRQAWEANRESYCRTYERTGSVLSEDLCERGYLWRGGDAVNMSIGQGDMEATPLQMAVVYAAIANGGKIVTPHVGRRIISPEGKVVGRLARKPRARVEADRASLTYVQRALRGVVDRGTGAFPYRSWPLDEIPMAGKTGSAEISGKQPFSWFASYGPTDDPKYVAIAVVEQAGFGSQVAGPVVRRIMDELFRLPPLPIIYGTARSD